jgi:hypothetical protein
MLEDSNSMCLKNLFKREIPHFVQGVAQAPSPVNEANTAEGGCATFSEQ